MENDMSSGAINVTNPSVNLPSFIDPGSGDSWFNRFFDPAGYDESRIQSLVNSDKYYNSFEAALNRKFNSVEAEKARAWSKEMSDTSYQRAVADLKKAGLNPILAYSNGGASSPSAAVASGSSASYNGSSSYGSSDKNLDIYKLISGLASSAGELGKIVAGLL